MEGDVVSGHWTEASVSKAEIWAEMCWGDLTPIWHLSPYPAACLLPAERQGRELDMQKQKEKKKKKQKQKQNLPNQPNRKTNNKQKQTSTQACGANTVQ